MKNGHSTPKDQSSRPHGNDSTPANGLLMPRTQTAIKQELAMALGWKAVGLAPTKGRRAIRRCLKKIGIPAEHIEAMMTAIMQGGAQ